MQVLEEATVSAQKMTSHADADEKVIKIKLYF